jgi:hypothetical protein
MVTHLLLDKLLIFSYLFFTLGVENIISIKLPFVTI